MTKFCHRFHLITSSDLPREFHEFLINQTTAENSSNKSTLIITVKCGIVSASFL